jgi:Fe-S cluster assembly ATP-binding protein
MTPLLQIQNLHVRVDAKEVLKGVNLEIKDGEVHTIMGPNGSGKSSLVLTLMGHPKYEVTEGKIIFKNKNIVQEKPEDRAKSGMFLSFQHPREISVHLGMYLRTIYNNYLKNISVEQISVFKFQQLLNEEMKKLKIDKKFAYRNLNEGFSGGEKKKLEILQMALLKPQLCILDEIDSGLDIDSLKNVCEGINALRATHPASSFLLVTHYQRILKYIKTDFVHVFKDGVIMKSGDNEFAKELEEKGYENM